MRAICKRSIVLVLLNLAVLPALAQLHEFKPGFNLFSKEQDVQLGKEAASEIEKQVEIVNNRELTAYVSSIGQKLVAHPKADKYPYTFKVVNDPSINAFALPGGPAFVNTGLIASVENESQLAGVLAHEIVHVALRHGTNQASRANLIQLPALIASAALGSGSMLAQLGQIGIGLGANSVLLRFSRTAETQADLLGVQIASAAGYDPIEMARFFKTLEAEGGGRGLQFFSSHPNPGNRQKAIEDEIRYLPKRSYDANTGQLERMKGIVAKLPPPKKTPAGAKTATGGGPAAAPSIPESRPSGRMQTYQGRDFSLSHPDNWKAYAHQNTGGVTIAPAAGMQQAGQGVSVGYGAIVDYYRPKRANASLRQATDELISTLMSADPRLRTSQQRARQIRVGGKTGLGTTLYSESLFQGQTEVDLLVTIPHPDGILHIVLIAPESERQYTSRVFDDMLRSLRFSF